jgi:predicted amidophosphoribosyltransferase
MYWTVAWSDNEIDTYYKDDYRGSYKLLTEPFCGKCASPLHLGASICNWSYAHPTSINRIHAIGYYIPVDSYHRSGASDFLSGHIYFSKYNSFKGEPLGLAIAECIRQKYQELAKSDFIVAVPRFSTEYHDDEVSDEPFNPPDILARWMKSELDIPIIEPLKKTREQRMKDLGLEERQTVVNGLYRCVSSDVIGKSILLVDDVSTSGCTMDECAKMLLNAGAKIVNGFVCGKTDPD